MGARLKIFTILCFTLISARGFSLTANKVWFEFHPGFYRVYVEYTVPEIKELRTAYVEFRSKKKAEKFYWSIIRGGEFELNDPSKVVFPKATVAPDPW